MGINDALRDGQDRRAWTAFDRRSWQRHPVLARLRAAAHSASRSSG